MQSSVDATMATPDGVGLADRTADHKHTVSRSDVQESFLHDLTHAERLLTVLWYAERMTVAEIGAVLDLSEAEVLNMHNRIVTRMRAA